MSETRASWWTSTDVEILPTTLPPCGSPRHAMFIVGSKASCNHAEKHLLRTLCTTQWRQKSRTNDGQTIKARPPSPETTPMTCNYLCSPDRI